MQGGEHSVEVWGQRYPVSVYQESKSVWHAVGDYMGQTIRTKDRSAGTALKRWREAARYKGNG